MTLGTWSCQHQPRTFMITITITYSCKARNTKFTEAQRHIRATITSERPSHQSDHRTMAPITPERPFPSERPSHQSRRLTKASPCSLNSVNSTHVILGACSGSYQQNSHTFL